MICKNALILGLLFCGSNFLLADCVETGDKTQCETSLEGTRPNCNKDMFICCQACTNCSTPTEVVMGCLKASTTKWLGSEDWRERLKQDEASVELVFAESNCTKYSGIGAQLFIPSMSFGGGKKGYFTVTKKGGEVEIASSFKASIRLFCDTEEEAKKVSSAEKSKEASFSELHDENTSCSRWDQRCRLGSQGVWYVDTDVESVTKMDYAKFEELSRLS